MSDFSRTNPKPWNLKVFDLSGNAIPDHTFVLKSEKFRQLEVLLTCINLDAVPLT